MNLQSKLKKYKLKKDILKEMNVYKDIIIDFKISMDNIIYAEPIIVHATIKDKSSLTLVYYMHERNIYPLLKEYHELKK